MVREGDRVAPGQVLARLDQTRFASTVGEIRARLFALKAKVARLRAEVVGRDTLTFADGWSNRPRRSPKSSVRSSSNVAPV
jgi:adhesin transport system membrane fusion protein